MKKQLVFIVFLGLATTLLSAPIRLAYNYCTLSYTMAFWSKDEWQAEVNRLAENGFNVALVLNGLPKVWQLTLREMGYPEDRIRAFMTDESAAAWWHMGNLEGLGGPLSEARIDADAELGRYLVETMRAKGIEPILQGFVGLVPSGTDGAKSQGKWWGYSRPSLLPLASEKFDRFADSWYQNLKKVYGLTDKNPARYLAGDLFHEGGSTQGLTDSDLAAIARKIQAIQARHFGDQVIWVIQSWLGTPPQGLRDGLDPKRTLIEFLDPDMSRKGPCGARYVNRTTGELLPWIWCEVLNFGGNPGLYGGVERFRTLPEIAREPGCVGFGMLSEGLETNEAMYALFAEAAVAETNVELEPFFERFAKRRYGFFDENLKEAFKLLARTVWSCPRAQQGTVENVICAFPSFNVKNVSAWGPRGGLYYDPTELAKARSLFEQSMASHKPLNEAMVYDWGEIAQQDYANRLRALNPVCATSSVARVEFLRLGNELAEKLAAIPRWTFRFRADRARKTAGEAGVKSLWRLYTTWTEAHEVARRSKLCEYAHRAYAELIRDYYLKRWTWFFEKADGKIDDAEYCRRLSALDSEF